MFGTGGGAITTMKKLLFFLTLLSVLLPLRARIIYEGDGTVLINGIYYDLMYNDVTQERTAWVSSGDIKYTVEIVIPQSVTYNDKTYKVTNVDLYKDNSQNVTSVSLPEGIIEVGLSECAITSLTIPSSVQSLYLYKCYGLTSINLPNNLKSLGVNYCTGLTEIAIPNGVEELSMRGCSQITTITIPASVREFEQSAFRGCTNLRSVTFSEGIKEIGAFIFESCSNLSSVNIPNSVKIIGDGAFIRTGLTSIVLPESLEEIGPSVFNGCQNLESIYIPNDVIMNARSVFAGCTALKNITFGNQVTMIGEGAFVDCTGLETIDIPSNIKTIGDDAFKGCSKLKSVTFHEGLETISKGAFYQCTSLTSIVIPNSVTNFGSLNDFASRGIFGYCTKLQSVTFGGGMTYIPWGAFANCTALESITIPANVTIIKGDAFSGCTSLTGDIILANGTTYIGSGAFTRTKISSIKIPATVTSFAYNALTLCDNLNKVIVPSLEQWCTQIDFSETYSISGGYNTTGLLHYASLYLEGHENTPINDVVIPDGVESISKYAFYDASITSIDIPGSVETIGSGVFEYCSQLKTITFHEGLKSIGNDAFAYCTALETLNLPNGLVELGAAFYQCTGLKSVEIPNSVTTAKYGYSGVFTGCTSLESVTIGSGLTTIPRAMFIGCKNLRSVKFSEGLKVISIEAFEGCIALESIAFPSTLTYIDADAFNDCAKLQKIIFPNSITGVNGGYTTSSDRYEPAFSGCTNLTQVIVPDFNIADWCGKSLVGGPLRYSHHLYDTDGNDLIVDAVIPEGVTKVTGCAFQGCESMTSLTLPSTIASIGSYSFGYCSNLTSVTSNMKTPCTLNSSVFYNLPTCTLYIPYGTKDAYIAKGWTENIFKGGIVEAVDTRVTQSLELTSLPAKTYGDEAYTLPENTVEGLTLTWESDNTNVATISGNTLTVTGAGTATITASQVGNEEYKPFSKEFALTVAKAPLTITANNATKNIGEANPAFTATYEGFVNGDDATVLTALPTFTTQADKNSPVGTYDIVVSGAEAANYEMNYVNGTLTVVDEWSMNNTLSLTDVQVLCGRQIILPVKMNNTENITAIQFDLTLPAGVSIAKNAQGKYIVEKTGRCADHMLNVSKPGDANVYRVLLYITPVENITGSEGAVLNVTLETSESMTEGEYDVTISNINLTTPDETKITPADVTCKLTVNNSIPGDANGDGSIDVTDIVSIANAILGRPSSSFDAAAADVNGDSSVDVTDIVVVANIILNQQSGVKARNDNPQREMDPREALIPD